MPQELWCTFDALLMRFWKCIGPMHFWFIFTWFWCISDARSHSFFSFGSWDADFSQHLTTVDQQLDMFTPASQGILFKDCVTFYEFTIWFWHSSSWNFKSICFTHPCSLCTFSLSEFHKTSWMKRIPLWQHPSIVCPAENYLWTHVLWRQSLVQFPGTFFFGVTCKHLIY